MSRQFQVTFDCADPNALATFWADVYNALLGDDDGYDPERGVSPWLEKDLGIDHRVVNLGPFGGNWDGQKGGFRVWVLNPEEAEGAAALLGKSLQQPNVLITYMDEV